MEKLVVCKCGKEFRTFPSAIKRGGGKYCSIKCSAKYAKRTSWLKGKKVPKEIKIKMSKSHKETHKQKQYGFKKGKLIGKNNYAKRQAVRKKISIANSGKNHWNWQGGITGKDYPKEWTSYLKERVKERDNFTCQICGSKGIKLNVHHINHNKKDCSLNNLTTWCTSCHMRYHNGSR